MVSSKSMTNEQCRALSSKFVNLLLRFGSFHDFSGKIFHDFLSVFYKTTKTVDSQLCATSNYVSLKRKLLNGSYLRLVLLVAVVVELLKYPFN